MISQTKKQGRKPPYPSPNDPNFNMKIIELVKFFEYDRNNANVEARLDVIEEKVKRILDILEG